MQATKSVLIVGGTSDIGRSTAMAYAEAGWDVVLAVRNEEGGRRNAEDIATRTGRNAVARGLDVLETVSLLPFVHSLSPLPDTVVCVVGQLGDQTRAQTDLSHAAETIRANFEAPALLLGLFAEQFQSRGAGTIVGVSSVAGDRGRASNYVYGAAKAGFTAFLSGLRNRLSGAGLRVLTVKPGFVRTRMTEGMKLPPLLTASADEVGRAIFKAAENGTSDVIYVRPVWRGVMTIIRAMPERLFKRLKL